MLRIEDCKPGVEVIAIKQKWLNPKKPLLSLGSIYTIKYVFDKLMVKGEAIHFNSIALEEMPLHLGVTRPWCYYLESFKLRDPEELYKIFDVKRHDILEPV